MTARPARLGVPLFAGGLVLALALADGGFFRWTWPWAIVALATAAVGFALLGRLTRVSWLAAAFVLGLGVLAAWQAATAWWSPDPERSLEDGFRGTVYAVGAATFVVLVRAAGPRRLLAGVVAGVAVTLAIGLADHARGQADPLQGSLLSQPIGYANAVGILGAVAALVAIGLLIDASSPATRVALLAAVGLCVLALVLTESRAAWLAAFLGLVTAIVFRLRGPRPWVLPAWLSAVTVALIAVLLSPLAFGSGSLHGLLSDRAYYWPVAWHGLDAPLHGLGAGSFAQLWALERPVPANAIDAHSLFLEALLELGAIGLVILVATLVLPLTAAPRLAGGWAAGATGAYTAFLVHAAVDWDWEMPVVSLAGVACGAALLAGGRRPPVGFRS
ncbi:MAG: O-antigen ligase family protein [Thermoleophilia bacterium]|nr:O-antigen ligase family protein [Thermoleophilia bacterium]